MTENETGREAVPAESLCAVIDNGSYAGMDRFGLDSFILNKDWLAVSPAG